MNRNDIIRMAREAGFAHSWSEAAGEALERFATLVAAAERERSTFELAESYRCGWDGGVQAEREACANVCDGWLHADGNQCAAAIRERDKK